MTATAAQHLVRLKEADIQNLRTGQPVTYTGDFYPKIRTYIKRHLDKAANSKSKMTFTKLIIASFGDGKSTLCSAMERQWLSSGFAVSHIYVRSEYQLNDLHLNLLRSLRLKDKDFFDLLLDVSLIKEGRSNNQILDWVYANHSKITNLVSHPSFKEGFWEWFAGDRIRNFNLLLSDNDIDIFTNKNDKSESRDFLYFFCKVLSENNMQPLLIIDELETITAYKNSRTTMKSITQLREIIDQANGCYSLIIASTEAFMREFQSSYRAVYERLYNEASSSASSTTWHLNTLRNADGVRDFFRLIKRSNPDWQSICDKDTEDFIQQILPDNQIQNLELRITLRNYIDLLDECTADGEYRGYIYDQVQEQAQQNNFERPDHPATDNEMYTQAPEHEYNYSHQSKWDALKRAVRKISRPLEDQPPRDNAELLSAGHDSAANNSVTDNESSHYDIDSSVHNLTAFLENEQLSHSEKELLLAKKAKDKKKKEPHLDIYERLVGRGSAHTTESLASLLNSAREVNNLRIITSNTASLLLNIEEQDFRAIPINHDQAQYEVVLHSHDGSNFLIFQPRNDFTKERGVNLRANLAQLTEIDSLKNLRKLAYLHLVITGDMIDDLDVDEFVIRTAEDFGGFTDESRDGTLFVKPSRTLFRPSANRTQVKEVRYLDNIHGY